MWEEILKAFSVVYLPSMLKFIFGPLAGYAAGLNLISTILGTVLGMMTMVFLFTYFGNWIKKKVLSRIFKKKNKFTDGNRRFVNVWKKYGLPGVALLTPVILTPIGGTLLALSSGSPREKIILYMFLSAAFWAIVFSVAIYFFGNEVLPDWVKPD
jgi:membrane protein DedA with SNARE-associated domain